MFGLKSILKKILHATDVMVVYYRRGEKWVPLWVVAEFWQLTPEGIEALRALCEDFEILGTYDGKVKVYLDLGGEEEYAEDAGGIQEDVSDTQAEQ